MTGQQLKNSILQEAIEGRLVPQDPNDEPASVLLERIRTEKARLVKEKKIKKDKNESRIYRTEDGHWMEHFEDKNREDVCIDEEIPFELPSGWEWCRIKELYSMQAGKNITSTEIRDDKNDEYCYPCYGGNGLRGYVNRYNTVGDFILVGRQGALCGNINRASGVFYATEHAVVTNNYGLTNTEWGYYILKALNLNQYATATAQPGLAVSNIIEVLIPLPPLAEQHRIVEKIESLLPKVEAYGKAQEELVKLTEALPDQLKKSILQEAIEGRLVPQDPNDEPASVLLERIRAEKARLVKEKKIKKDKNESRIYRTEDGHWMEHFEDKNREDICIDEEIPFDVPSGWEWERWGNISQSIQYGYNAPAEVSGIIRMVRISDIQENKVIWDSVPYCNIKESDIDNYLLCPNDILFARTGGTVGKSFLVKDTPYKAIYAGYLIRTRYSNMLRPEYLKYYMESRLYWEQLRNGTIATAQPNCNGQTLSKMFVPIPPLAEQHRIVEMIESLLPKIEKLKVNK